MHKNTYKYSTLYKYSNKVGYNITAQVIIYIVPPINI